jgi:hypothetical protein
MSVTVRLRASSFEGIWACHKVIAQQRARLTISFGTRTQQVLRAVDPGGSRQCGWLLRRVRRIRPFGAPRLLPRGEPTGWTLERDPAKGWSARRAQVRIRMPAAAKRLTMEPG